MFIIPNVPLFEAGKIDEAKLLAQTPNSTLHG